MRKTVDLNLITDPHLSLPLLLCVLEGLLQVVHLLIQVRDGVRCLKQSINGISWCIFITKSVCVCVCVCACVRACVRACVCVCVCVSVCVSVCEREKPHGSWILGKNYVFHCISVSTCVVSTGMCVCNSILCFVPVGLLRSAVSQTMIESALRQILQKQR